MARETGEGCGAREISMAGAEKGTPSKIMLILPRSINNYYIERLQLFWERISS